MIGNNAKFLNATSRVPGAPSSQYTTVLVSRENYKLKLTVIKNGVTDNAPTNVGISWTNDQWMHIVVGVENVAVAGGGTQEIVSLYFNGQRVAFSAAPASPYVQLKSELSVSLGQKGPGNTAGTAGVLGNSILHIADFSAFYLPQKVDDLALNLDHKRNVAAVYGDADANPAWSDYSFHTVDFPNYQCGSCPCNPGTCETTPDGFKCMCGATECT
eukprot:2780443-Rhodomonas_salina.1